MLESANVIEGVITYAMTCLYHLTVHLGMLAHIVAHHKEGGLDALVGKHLKDKRRSLGDWAVVEGEIYSLLVTVHSPSSPGI